jgi:hypothetical protein
MKKIIVSDITEGVPLVGKYFDFVTDITSDICLAINSETSGFLPQIYNYLKATGIPIIGTSTQRMNKINQVHIFRRYGINHPMSFFNEKDSTCLNTPCKLNAYCDLEQFVVKPIFGARGIGVKLINRKDYKECLYDNSKIESVFHKEIHEYLKSSSDVSDNYIAQNIDLMLIQEPIKVKREFRCLYFAPDKIVSYEREKSPDQFCGNLSHGSKPRQVEKNYFDLYLRPFVEKFKPIMEEFRYPWISIDVYEDMDGNLGCFEFQMEFAYEGFDHKQIRELMKNTIEYFISK